jgi:hypothetical protein
MAAVVIACSPAVEKPQSSACSGKKAKTPACQPGGGAVLDAGLVAPVPVAPATVPPLDAGRRDAAAPPMKPDGGRPVVPPANTACRDLGACCNRIQSTVERAACVAVVVASKPSVCATAIIGYQVLGCNHTPFSLGSFGINPDDQNGDGVPNWVDPQTPSTETYNLEDYCRDHPEEVWSCGGSYDACGLDPSNCQGHDTYCAAHPSDELECGAAPGPEDYCTQHPEDVLYCGSPSTDDYCTLHPEDEFYCGTYDPLPY